MTQTSYSAAVVNALLGWLKGLASWVLKLFDLAGSGSPLRWLSDNWLKLLIVLILLGLAIDFTVWMFRWRPYWVWFKKKRIIVNDEKLLAGEDKLAAEARGRLERDYTVGEAPARRRAAVPAETSARRREKPPEKHRPISRDELSDDLFEVGRGTDGYLDYYEDEVFNVESLTGEGEPKKGSRKHGRH